MVNQTVLEENWNDIKATLKSKWQQLSDHDLRGFKGSADQLVQMIQSRTGQARDVIENQLEEMIAQGRTIQNQVGQFFSGAASQAGEVYAEGHDVPLRSWQMDTSRCPDTRKTIRVQPSPFCSEADFWLVSVWRC